MSTRLAGLFLPVTTPFGPDGRADPDRLAAQIEIYIQWPIAGIVLFGTSGEGPLLEDDEQGPLLEAARAALPRDRVLIVQVGRESARAACAAAARAAVGGADALLALPPRYYSASRAALADYYRAIARAVDLPLYAYHIPQRSKVDLPADLLKELGLEATLAGIKDSAGDLALQAELRRVAGPDFAILDGKASVLAASLAGGADGAILAVADAAPEAALAVLEAHGAGDGSAATRAQERLSPLGEALGPRFGVAGIKAALDLRGWPGGGVPRAPLVALDESARAEVATALRAADVPLS
ncbi:MAG: dihydrodipicolinate synthase family protein [Gemmatimonadota bacterium]